MPELSPLMQQYLSIKENYKDNTIVFFRVGDFYEMFFDDAKTASRELELTLTGKECGLSERAPMCGVPFHSYETYAARLIAKGYKVAICEQTEDPSKTKKLVRREVIRVLTPGTVTEQSMLSEDSNNYICVIYILRDKAGVAFCDISTGELFATLITSPELESALKDELIKFSPREIIVGGNTEKLEGISPFIKDKLSACVSMLPDESFSYADSKALISQLFGGKTPEELGLENKNQTVCALGALISYLKDNRKESIGRINDLELYEEENFVHIDYNTRKNLELTEPLNSKNHSACLFAVLDSTKTSFGKRLLKSYIEKPLISIGRITRRLNAVQELFDNARMRCELRDGLSGMHDIQRMITRIIGGNSGARELRMLCQALQRVPIVKDSIKDAESQLLREMYDGLDNMEDVVRLIDSVIEDDPPFTVREGGLIRPGVSKELDELKYDMENSSGLMAGIERRERERTGIPKLKIGYNRVFGYYLEVSNSYKNMVPEDYIRKQTLTGGERYITEELKQLERRLLGAKERANALEYELYNKIRETVSAASERISKTAGCAATLDVIASLAHVAVENDYCCPRLNNSGIIDIKNGRHPVVEKLMKDASFVPNDTYLDTGKNRTAIITGPNMAGKSTYMRQTALIVLMAQMGSFVPASNADISVTDGVFTRIGASDDLSTGQSTFMVEMNEVAYILKKATKKSLIILDEIGRGTSTYDGMSIARAVLEYVSDTKKLGAKTLFSTHYHELTVLESELEGVRNYNIAAVKHGGEITFLRRILPGAADESYGVEVASLAGLPKSVITRAKKILRKLEEGKGEIHTPALRDQDEEEDIQLSMIQEESLAEKRLREIDVNKLTPMEAMNLLFELTKLLDK